MAVKRKFREMECNQVAEENDCVGAANFSKKKKNCA